MARIAPRRSHLRVPGILTTMANRHQSFRLRLFVVGLVLTFLAISWITALVEGWNWLDGLYYGVAVMTTVGFGDFTPQTDAGKIITLVLSPLGIILGFGIGLLLLQDSFMRLVQRRRHGMVPRKLSGHYIVIGYGRTGQAVVETLINLGHEVCVLETSSEARTLLEKRHVPYIIGTALDQENIDAAMVATCAGVIVTFENDAESVYVTLEVRERRADVPLIVTASTHDSARRLELAGATRTILSRSVAGDMLAKAALNPEMLGLVTAGASGLDKAHAAFAQVYVNDDSWLAGMQLRETGSRAPGALVVMALIGEKRRLAPGPDMPIKSGMILVLVGDADAIAAYEQLKAPSEELTKELAQRRNAEE